MRVHTHTHKHTPTHTCGALRYDAVRPQKKKPFQFQEQEERHTREMLSVQKSAETLIKNKLNEMKIFCDEQEKV